METLATTSYRRLTYPRHGSFVRLTRLTASNEFRVYLGNPLTKSHADHRGTTDYLHHGNITICFTIATTERAQCGPDSPSSLGPATASLTISTNIRRHPESGNKVHFQFICMKIAVMLNESLHEHDAFTRHHWLMIALITVLCKFKVYCLSLARTFVRNFHVISLFLSHERPINTFYQIR